MRTFRTSLLAAAAVHAALLVLVRGPKPPRARPLVAAEPGVEIDVDVRSGLATSDEPTPRPVVHASSREAMRVATRESTPPPATSAEVVATTTSEAMGARAEATPEATGSDAPPWANGPAALDPARLGMGGGANPFLGRPEPDAPVPNGAEREVRNELRDRDTSLGLGASGPAVLAAEEIVRRSTVSVESHATFELTTDREGRLVSVRVGDASDDRAAWDAAAKALLAALVSHRFHVPARARGMAMTIAIDSREAMPSGTAPGIGVSVLGQKVHSGKNERSATVSILPLMRIPILGQAPGGKGELQTREIAVPVPLPAIAGVGDVSDLGAKAQRVVHAHATLEREL